MKMLRIVCASVMIATTTAVVPAASEAAPKLYICPACGCAADDRTFDKPGVCPSCGMQLIEKSGNSKPQQTSVAVLLFDGAEIIDYAGPWEVFGQAGFKIFTVAENSKPIDAIFGQKLIPDYTFGSAPPADIVLVPGGAGSRKAMQNAVVLKWLQQRAQSSKYVMSVCTGALILAKAGLLDGLSATTFHDAIDLLVQIAPKTRVVNDQRYVDNGKIITTAGLSSGIDGALYLVSKIKSKGFAQAAALNLEYQWNPESKFGRAAFADRYLPRIYEFDGEILSADGDVDHWQARALLSKPNSTAAILDLLGKRVAENTPHAKSAVVVERADDSSSADIGTLQWNFIGDDSRRWYGRALVEPSTEEPQKFVLSLRLNSGSTPK
jgi:putative intracellular protease/amidase